MSSKITKASKNSHNTSERIESETKIPGGIYIFPEKRQKIIDKLRLI